MESTPDYQPSPLPRDVYTGLRSAACVTKSALMPSAGQGVALVSTY
jgi:hypothetical protein